MELWQRFNTVDPGDAASAGTVLGELLGGVGAEAWIEVPAGVLAVGNPCRVVRQV